MASRPILCYDIPKALIHSGMFLFLKGISHFIISNYIQENLDAFIPN